MRPCGKGALSIALLIAVLGVAAVGCGEEAEKDVVEGEPLELGDLRFNVQLTRFLNANDREDSEYLSGQQVPPPAGKLYLGVFMEVENEGDEEARLPGVSGLSVVDTTGAAYPPTPSETDFALDLGGTIPAHDEIPAADTAAASGPVQGSIVIFLVEESASENRPLELEINYEGEDGTIELDI
jgi:hypothetical protein